MPEEQIARIIDDLKPEASAPFIEGWIARVSPPYPNPFRYGTWQSSEFEAGWQAADNSTAEGVLAHG